MKTKTRSLILALGVLLAIGTIGATEARAQHGRGGYHHGYGHARGYGAYRPHYGHGYGHGYAPRVYNNGWNYGGGAYLNPGGFGYSSGYGGVAVPYYGSGYTYAPGYGYSNYGRYCR